MLKMDIVSSSTENRQRLPDTEQEAVAEERFIQQYAELTGASEVQSRSVFMYFDIIRLREPSCQRIG
jgi:hypothetical protein